MERLRLMCWCRHCVSGLHLPAYAAAGEGLFAEAGIEIEFVDCVKTPGGSLLNWSAMSTAVAEGEADLALTSVAYHLAGQVAAGGELAARFAAVFHQRNPIAAMVRHDSPLRTAPDVGARTMARSPTWYIQEFEAAVDHLGIARPTYVDGVTDACTDLRDGAVDMLPGWVDMEPSYSGDGLIVRTIPLEGDPVYTTGLVVADRLSSDLVVRVRDALAAGYRAQRAQPEVGIERLRCDRPNISEQHLSTAWSIFEPYAFAQEPLAMDAERWRQTIDYTAAAHGLPSLPAEQVYRPELLAPAGSLALA